MTKLVQRGHEVAASLLVPSIALLVLSLALLAIALFPASGLAAEEGEGPPAPAEAPALSFSPAPLDFGKTTVGTESTAVTVDVYNEGGATGIITGVSPEGGDSSDFKVTGSNCGQLDPGQHCSVWVSFAPGGTGAKQAWLVANLKESPSQSTPIYGTGALPQLAFTPGSYDFGVQHVNRGESQAYFQLANVGEAGVQIGSLGIGGKDSSNFWSNGGDCWNGRWLQPGESCNVQIVFNPWDMVAYEAEVQVSANGSTFAAPLTGTGGRAMVEPASNPTDFGAVTVGAEGPVETIVFTNHGNLPGNFFIGIVAGGDAGSFHLLDESCSANPVPPAGTCTAHIRFAPQDAGPKLARMALFGDDEGGTMAMLKGEGAAPAVTLAPFSFDFGEQALDGRSAARAFAVHNDGSTPLDLDGVAISGADPDQFVLAGDACSGATLAPGAECLVRIRFAPDGAGAKAATLRVYGAAGAFTAALSGRGVDSPDSGGVESDFSAGPGAHFAGAPDGRRPGAHRGRRHRFSHGDAVVSRRGRAMRRAGIHERTTPR